MKKINDQEAEQQNLKYWNEIAPIHYESYDIESLRQGKSHIDKIQQRELYPIQDKTLLHLQCHIGTDSLSLARDGAVVTGIDFSAKSIEIANQLKEELDIPATFIHSNVYDLKEKLDQKFDIVYTSQGVLAWLKDLQKWAATIVHFLKEGGTFYIMEIHPLYYIFDLDARKEIQIQYPYFHQKHPTFWDEEIGDYSARDYVSQNKTYEWTWSMSDILNALIQSGLTIEFLNEYDKLFYRGLEGMEQVEKGWWIHPKYKGMIPFTFTLKATK